jgi:DNA transposition AAA+ family ATPase
MKPKVATTKNVLRLAAAYELMEHQGAGMEIGLIHGFTGYGKTWAVHHLIGQKNALYLESSPNWSSLTLLEDLALELGFDVDRRNTRYLERAVIAKLRETKRAVFIDEFDRVLNSPNARRLVETLRMLHDQATVPLLLVGEDRAEIRLARHPQFDRRTSQRIRFAAVDLDDTREIAETCCEVAIADDLLEKLNQAVSGSTAFIAMGLSQIESYARANRWSEISAAQYSQPFVSPNRRSTGGTT